MKKTILAVLFLAFQANAEILAQDTDPELCDYLREEIAKVCETNSNRDACFEQTLSEESDLNQIDCALRSNQQN